MLKVPHYTYCLILLFSCLSSKEEIIDLIPDPEITQKPPSWIIADFHTFNLAFYGCEEIKSNRNWNALNDSVYLTVDKIPDSIIVFETRGIEKFELIRTNENSLSVKGCDNQFLDLVDWRHSYDQPETLQISKHTFQLSQAAPTIDAFPSYSSEDFERELKKVELHLGTNNWSNSKQYGYETKRITSRTFFRAKAWFNNGDSTQKSIVLHYVN